jgi:hypothetical protein
VHEEIQVPIAFKKKGLEIRTFESGQTSIAALTRQTCLLFQNK